MKKIETKGLNQEVSLDCNVDEGDGSFDLIIAPKVRLNIDGVEGDYSLGEKLPFRSNPDKFIFVGYIGTKKGTGSERDLYVRFVETPYRGEKLTDAMLSEVARLDDKDSNSIVSFGEETIFSYKIYKIGYDLFIDQRARTKHFLTEIGGTRDKGIKEYYSSAKNDAKLYEKIIKKISLEKRGMSRILI